MKILHLLSSDIYSGAEKVACDIIESLSEDYEMMYASPVGINLKYLKSRNIDFLPLKKMNISEIYKVINSYKPDLIHAHDFRASTLAGFIGVFSQIPVIAHLHNNSPWIASLNVYSITFLLSSYRIRKILGVSSSILDEYIFSKQIKEKFEERFNPIDVNSIIKKSQEYSIDDSYDLVFVGRLSSEKNPLEFLEIVKVLKEEYPELRAVILGDGPLIESCKEYAKQNLAIGSVEFKGYVENPMPFILKAKIMVITSLWEGFGLAAVEALSMGKPVIARNVGGLKKIINADCGALCDTKEHFIRECVKLLSRSDIYMRKSEVAVNRAWQLDNREEYKKEIKRIYNEILQRLM